MRETGPPSGQCGLGVAAENSLSDEVGFYVLPHLRQRMHGLRHSGNQALAQSRTAGSPWSTLILPRRRCLVKDRTGTCDFGA